MAFRSSSNLAGGSGPTVPIPVPAGAAVDDIGVVGMYLETLEVLSPPDGTWNEKVSLEANFGGGSGRLTVWWKRLEAADSGTWTFTHGGGSVWRAAVSGLWSGRAASGDPWTAHSTNEQSGVSAVTAAGITAVEDDDLVCIATINAAGAYGQPAGMTEREDNGDEAALASQDAVGAGSTGNKQYTSSASANFKIFLGALAFDATGSDPGYGYLITDGTDRLLLGTGTDKLLLSTNESPPSPLATALPNPYTRRLWMLTR